MTTESMRARAAAFMRDRKGNFKPEPSDFVKALAASALKGAVATTKREGRRHLKAVQ